MVRSAIVHGLTRPERQRLRRALGRLETNLVRKSTLERYCRAFTDFTQYVGESYSSWPSTPAQFDSIVSEYLEVLWDAGETKSTAAYTLAAIHYYLPRLKHQLSRSWKLKAIWDKLELPCRAVPFLIFLHFLPSLGIFTSEKINAWDWHALLGSMAFSEPGNSSTSQ